jgi:hypothetical protein
MKVFGVVVSTFQIDWMHSQLRFLVFPPSCTLEAAVVVGESLVDLHRTHENAETVIGERLVGDRHDALGYAP